MEEAHTLMRPYLLAEGDILAYNKIVTLVTVMKEKKNKML